MLSLPINVISHDYLPSLTIVHTNIQAEKEWLNAYHVTVRAKLTPLVEQLFPEALQYLHDETKPI